jgi:hypothetical protein
MEKDEHAVHTTIYDYEYDYLPFVLNRSARILPQSSSTASISTYNSVGTYFALQATLWST